MECPDCGEDVERYGLRLGCTYCGWRENPTSLADAVRSLRAED